MWNVSSRELMNMPLPCNRTTSIPRPERCAITAWYIAGAIEDHGFPDDMKERLEEALTKAGIDHRIETYQAKHGWVFRDTPVYDAAAAERHWQSMFALFDATLKH